MSVARIACSQANVRIPAIHGTTFAGQTVDLPQSLQDKVGILVVGFTQDSRESVKGWGLKLSTDYAGSTSVVYYNMPVLASVPRLLRGFVAGKIKESVSDAAKPHFLPITENETAWRGVTEYKAGDDAYVLVVDGRGMVRWQTHGAVNDDAYKRVREHIVAIEHSK